MSGCPIEVALDEDTWKMVAIYNADSSQPRDEERLITSGAIIVNEVVFVEGGDRLAAYVATHPGNGRLADFLLIVCSAEFIANNDWICGCSCQATYLAPQFIRQAEEREDLVQATKLDVHFRCIPMVTGSAYHCIVFQILTSPICLPGIANYVDLPNHRHWFLALCQLALLEEYFCKVNDAVQ
ncbi:hypothetical protein LTR27_006191 [Elasticomyces elasticus]|nr:hypothetical protein LTR27_006191 [Elasticomyces elasticus]